jgi:Ni/Fe-hydrogenase subunit HybB-like protein
MVTASVDTSSQAYGDLPLEDPVQGREPLVRGDHDFHYVTETVCRVAETPLLQTPKTAVFAWLLAVNVLAFLGALILYLFWEGVGIWGNNNPVGWGWPIVNFVFWVGIGHAGTLISAILYLFRQNWRTSINRFAEAMTIFAVICALVFPGIHVGRIWAVYWLFPLPNQMDMWPNFRSPLLWDVFAVGTYFTVSLLFWFTGLVPDFATLRDRAKHKVARVFYGLASMGWRGSMRHWWHYEKAYQIMACFSAPLVLSVHTVVSFDFAVSQLPGWHTTIFPPYFVAGAILKHIITIKHIENMNKIIMLTGSLVGYAYSMEFFVAWYSGNEYEGFAFINRAFGQYWWAYWIMMSCNVFSPQFFWIRKLRTNIIFSFILSIFVNIGMWFERFVITVTSLANDFVPSSWDYFVPTWVDISMFIGSFGLFFTLFLLFCRFFPVIAIAEVKAVMPQADPHYHPDHGHHDGDHGHAAAAEGEG